MIDSSHKKLPLWPETEKRLKIVPEGMWPFTPEEYGKRLHDRRVDLNYTLKGLASAVGCTVQNIQKIESGVPTEINGKIIHVPNKKINPAYVPAFAEKLECSCAYLLGYTDEANGTWDDPSTTLHYPIISYRPDEILSIATIIQAYNRDPALFFACIEMLKETCPRTREIYKTEIVRLVKQEKGKKVVKVIKQLKKMVAAKNEPLA